MSNSLIDKAKTISFHALIIFVIVFLQFVFLNIMPGRANEIDFFLIVSAFYILRIEYKIAFPFLFIAVFIDEIVFPIAKIIGLKTLAALILAYILFLVFKKMVLKGWLLCLTIATYSVMVFIFTKLLLAFLNYSDLSFILSDYIWLFINSFLITCIVGKKFNVR
ncbi:hypothetical protein TTHT_0538 [Thermotomaculum hydrothermale]|uniref:Uncharacterized protein n=1 Tax=Thermotomaculum hydrothermale TaxID=981385 RepID=A0A7R6PGE9_9BACT|nr:hypothetical protein [Thermotomaculum hydrothermale]BBB32124.1 hypothetical protein TTHT_0538 [Thermotomaculum hydrothermale]